MTMPTCSACLMRSVYCLHPVSLNQSSHPLHHTLKNPSVEMTSPPKASLYYFRGSVFASVPLLTAIEKGFTETQLEKKEVNLLEGQNFSPAYLKISPKGTVPALVVPYEHTVTSNIPTKFKSILTTIEICQFLDSSTLSTSTHNAPALSPATIQGASDSSQIIQKVHSPDAPDPNFLLLSARNDAEREAKNNGLPGSFLKGRQKALEKYAAEAGDADARLSVFYETKTKENGALLAIYEGKEDPSGFYKMANEGWTNLVKTLAFFESKLSSTFLVGDQISLADLHAGAYMARVLAVAGASDLNAAEAAAKLDSQLPGGAKVGPKLIAWLGAIFERQSFRTVYADGLH